MTLEHKGFPLQEVRCMKCMAHIGFSNDYKFCPYCGAEIPDCAKPQKVVCPLCQGAGKIDQLTAYMHRDIAPAVINGGNNDTK